MLKEPESLSQCRYSLFIVLILRSFHYPSTLVHRREGFQCSVHACRLSPMGAAVVYLLKKSQHRTLKPVPIGFSRNGVRMLRKLGKKQLQQVLLASFSVFTNFKESCQFYDNSFGCSKMGYLLSVLQSDLDIPGHDEDCYRRVCVYEDTSLVWNFLFSHDRMYYRASFDIRCCLFDQ